MLQVMPISSPSPEASPHDSKTQVIIAQSVCGDGRYYRQGYGKNLAEAPIFSIWNLTSGAGIRIDTSNYLTQKYGGEYPNAVPHHLRLTDHSSLFKAGRAGLAIVFPSGVRGPEEMNGRNRRVKLRCVTSCDRAAFHPQIVLQRYCHRLSISRGFISILSPTTISPSSTTTSELHAFSSSILRSWRESGFSLPPSRHWCFPKPHLDGFRGRVMEGTTAWTAPSERTYRWPSRAEYQSGIVTILDCSAHPLFQVPPATS
ncbi:hypothetical protein BKA62DRAFT_725014, partial [Auriculariales sp. MPI-PUGE-AT-0066]